MHLTKSLFCLPLLLSAAALAQAPGAWPRARWLENGLIDAGGTHEGYLFTVRRGGQRLDARRQYEHAQSAEVIQGLARQGVEVFHTHLYKGFGMAAEKAEMEDAVRVAAIAHRAGMKVDSYIQWNSLMYETFFAEEPRAKDWVERDALGQPILLTYGYQQSFRYRPCFANREYLDYLKRVVRFAVEEVKTDFIHFDNFDLNPEPESCHDATCTAGFREFLRRKYTPQERRERLGFDNVDFVNPPQWNGGNRPDAMRVIFDPVIQEWIDYRCQVMADALRQMAGYARSLNPEVAIEINPGGVTGDNRAWAHGIDHARLLPLTDAFWSEEGNTPGLAADGRLVSRIRSYKLARAFHNIMLTYVAGDPLAMAESLAFNQTFGCAGFVGTATGNGALDAETLRYLAFYRRHRELFRGTRDAGGVAVFRSYPSITYDHFRTQLSAVLTEQALIQARVPFELVTDDGLADLSRLKVLILPDAECLADAQLAAIAGFVAGGGGLVAIGQAGLYDQWRRGRVTPGLSRLIDGQKPGSSYEEDPLGAESGGAATRREVGRGRSVYLPALRFDGPLPQPGRYFGVSNRYWKRPANWEELVDAVRWAARDELPVRVDGPPYLVANLVAQPAEHRLLLHLVNYQRPATTSGGARYPGRPIAGATVRCRVPPERVRIYSPDAEVVTAAVGPDGSFRLPAIGTYAIAVMDAVRETPRRATP
ncbi:MAG: hypothetical protein ABSG86_26900 [Thermoguttaceae bacterium]